MSLGLEPWKILFFLCGFCRVRIRLNEQVFPFSAALASANDPHMLDNIKVHLIERKNLALGKEGRWAWNLATAHSFLLPGPTLERAHESASHLEALFRPTSTALLAWSKGIHCRGLPATTSDYFPLSPCFSHPLTHCHTH